MPNKRKSGQEDLFYWNLLRCVPDSSETCSKVYAQYIRRYPRKDEVSFEDFKRKLEELRLQGFVLVEEVFFFKNEYHPNKVAICQRTNNGRLTLPTRK